MKKKRYAAKTCSVLLHENVEIRDPNIIRNVQKDYYSDLYEEEKSIKFMLTNNLNVFVLTEVRQQQNLPFSISESIKALSSMSRIINVQVETE